VAPLGIALRLLGGLRGAAAGLALALLVSFGAYELLNARGIQVVGTIVPRVDTARPLVALTFDDGPTPPYTEELLRVFAEKNAKATFFVIGRNVEKYPDLAARMVAAGHELGNHSYSHTRMVLKSYDFMRSEIERTDTLIRSAGSTGPIHFRSPYGKKLFLLPLYLWRAEKRNILADVEPDAFGGDADAMVKHVLAHVTAGSIVIMHAENAARGESLKAVPGIIDGLQRDGYQLVTISELLDAR
jgi:peptidoglycan/xylan/chitin deacetylase (PgdA/CDA1 family)